MGRRKDLLMMVKEVYDISCIDLTYTYTYTYIHRLTYLNSGGFMGRRKDLLRMVKEVMTYHGRFASDQVGPSIYLYLSMYCR